MALIKLVPIMYTIWSGNKDYLSIYLSKDSVQKIVAIIGQKTPPQIIIGHFSITHFK
jgi:hypothetical protein